MIMFYEPENSKQYAVNCMRTNVKHCQRYFNVDSSPITGLDRPRGFQEVKVPRFRDNGTGWW